MSITSKNDFPLDANSIDGTELCARINRWHDDMATGNASGTRPPYIKAGGTWISDAGASATPRYSLMIYNGVTDVAAGGSSFDAGTKITFNQTAAPTGWTKITTNDNAALRVVSGSVGSGGSVAFTTAFASHTPAGTIVNSGTTGSHTLTIAEIPGHTHNVVGHTSGGGLFNINNNYSTSTNDNTGTEPTQSTGGGGGHTHAFTGTSTFTGTAINLAVKYVDVIICSKD